MLEQVDMVNCRRYPPQAGTIMIGLQQTISGPQPVTAQYSVFPAVNVVSGYCGEFKARLFADSIKQ